MSADIPDKLRALTRDHLEGRTSLASHRRLRAQLLDGLVASAAGVPPDATQPRIAALPSDGNRSQARTPPHPAEVTQPRAQSAAAPPASMTPPASTGSPESTPSAASIPSARSTASVAPTASPNEVGGSGPPPAPAGAGRIAGYAALAVVLAAAVGFLVWRHHSHVLSTPAAAAGGTGAQPAGQGDPIHALLEPLLESPDWSDARLLALNEALLEAGRPRIEAVRDTEWFDAVVDSVRSRLLQQQALTSSPLTPDRSPLAALAATLGIDLSALASPAHTATAATEGEGRHSPAEAAAQAPAQEAPRVAAPEKTAAAHSKAESSAAPTRAPAPASTHPASVSREGGAQLTRAAPGAPDGAVTPPAGAGGSASMTPNASAKTAAHHEYPACSAALSQVRLNYCQDFLDSGDPAPLLVLIPSGSFMMGNSDSAAESPVHRVTLVHVFAMSAYEVSQAEFQLYCRTAGKACPQQPWTRDDDPVVNVSWQDAQDYAKWLSAATHQRYRLPTEAEWEYAARAGRTGLYPSGDSLSQTDAYFSMGETLSAPAPRSMRFNANAWHLMHMIGNVREWVEDGWSPTLAGAPDDGSAQQGDPGTKVVRGGYYADSAVKLRLTTREPLAADTHDRCTGIRLVREVH
jgi:formylglycine-generating enzyme required for sulfatase activity